MKSRWELYAAPAIGVLAVAWLTLRTVTRPIPKALDFAALIALLAVLYVHWDNNRSLDKVHRRKDDDGLE